MISILKVCILFFGKVLLLGLLWRWYWPTTSFRAAQWSILRMKIFWDKVHFLIIINPKWTKFTLFWDKVHFFYNNLDQVHYFSRQSSLFRSVWSISIFLENGQIRNFDLAFFTFGPDKYYFILETWIPFPNLVH